MSNVQPFTLDDLKKRIAENTQAQFGALIPKEMFEGLIEESIKAFFENTQRYEVKEITHPDDTRKHRYEQRKLSVLTEEMTPFRQMVWLRLKVLVAPMIDEWLAANVEHLRTHANELLNGPDLSKPFNQAVGSLAAVVQQQQIYTAMDAALSNVGAQVTQAMQTQLIPDGIGVGLVPGVRS